MITVDFELSQIRANASTRTLEAVLAITTSEAELRAPARGTASDPVKAWLAADDTQASDLDHRITLPDLEWTEQHEQRFIALAGREALDTLTLVEKRELEHLSNLRRGLRNPRSGEELIWEYNQRELTRSLVEAVNRYVSFHKRAD
ncbi:MAG: hypothetical protein HY298_25335 [Verrucomicrobia bacterium]|nr:hypothetical protein [Verrucomicrobiota bacterium]